MDKKIESEATKYSYEQLIASKRYNGRRDLLDALLEHSKTYTIDEIDALIDSFMKGPVK